MADSPLFRKEIKQGRQFDPREQFALSTIESEVRYDPLTNDSGRICHFVFAVAPPMKLDDLIARSAKQCPFCPDSVLTVTPRFPADVLTEGRLQHGDAALFPNLFPYDDLSAVAVISPTHSSRHADRCRGRGDRRFRRRPATRAALFREPEFVEF